MDIKRMIGTRIAEIRNRKGMTQEELAGKMGINPKYLSSIERGKENPTLNTIISLSISLGVDLNEMFSFVEIQDPIKRKSLVTAFLNEADSEQMKIAYKFLYSIMR